ncbi:MAG: hypothetical protein AAF772_08275 [Acidobacteriota bacterium]
MADSNAPSHTRLGQLLVEHGNVTGEQLIRAIQSQRLVGGRIGTCLLEMEAISEERLLEILSDQLSVPAVRIEQMRFIQRGVLDLIPSALAARCLAIPFDATPSELLIATLNVNNLALLDEIAFSASRRVVPYIANEVRIFEALEKYYGEECPQRYRLLLDRLNRSRYLWRDAVRKELEPHEHRALDVWNQPGENGPHVFTSAASHTARRRSRYDERRDAAPDARPAAAASDTSPQKSPYRTQPLPLGAGLKEQGLGTGSDLLPPRTPKPRRRMTLKDVDRLLAHQDDHHGIGKTLVRYLAQTFVRCCLLKVIDGQVVGWLAHGVNFDMARFDDLAFDLDAPSIFQTLHAAEGPDAPTEHLGLLDADNALHQALFATLGAGEPCDSFLMPVRIRERTICFFYGDRNGASLDNVDRETLRRLSTKVAIAFELCILRRRMRNL